MKIAIYGREFNDHVIPFIQEVFNALAPQKAEISVYDKFYDFIKHKVKIKRKPNIFTNHQQLVNSAKVLLSLGGDGTLLDTLALIRDSEIQVTGINFGRLGFLASINKNDIHCAMTELINGNYTLDKRSILNIESESRLFGNENFALNDITIHRRNNSAMMVIHAYMDGEFLNSYWADGLIIATPTGSTAYSLSCGGPIIHPNAQNFVITPIASHNLNVRPIVVSDKVNFTFEIDVRSAKFLVSCDSRTVTVNRSVKVSVKKGKFYINFIRLNKETYLTTLREKLMWGIDKRNY